MTEKIDRWAKAQDYEKNWWSEVEDGFDLGYLEYYADELHKELNGIFEIKEETSILEIGSGPAGILTHLKSKNRHAVEPLEDYFCTVPQFAEYRDNVVQYHRGMGEDLVFKDNYFDLVIMDNVLDHCESPARVLSEVSRVTKPGGILYFRQHVFHRWGINVRRLMEAFQVDHGHPHSFSKKVLDQMLTRRGFAVLREKESGHFEFWKADIKSGQRKRLMKSMLLANWNNLLYVLRKDPGWKT